MTSMDLFPRIAPLRFDLPALTAAQVASQNIGPMDTTSFIMRPSPINPIEAAFDPRRIPRRVAEVIQLTVGGDKILVQLEKSLVRPLLQEAGQQDVADGVMQDSSLAAVTLEHFLTAGLEKIEEAHGLRLQIDSVAPPPPDSPPIVLGVGFRLAAPFWPGGCAGQIVATTHSAAEQVRRLLSGFLIAHDWCRPDLDCPVRVTSASFLLNWSDLRQLRPGDGVLFAPEFSLQSQVWLAMSPRHHVAATWREDKLTVTHISNRGRRMMEQTTDKAFDDDGLLVEDIPVVLSLELDRINLSFSELEDLRIGTILPFRSGPPKAVKVLANGRPIAMAELLMIDDRMGIRITSLTSRLE